MRSVERGTTGATSDRRPRWRPEQTGGPAWPPRPPFPPTPSPRSPARPATGGRRPGTTGRPRRPPRPAPGRSGEPPRTPAAQSPRRGGPAPPARRDAPPPPSPPSPPRTHRPGPAGPVCSEMERAWSASWTVWMKRVIACDLVVDARPCRTLPIRLLQRRLVHDSIASPAPQGCSASFLCGERPGCLRFVSCHHIWWAADRRPHPLPFIPRPARTQTRTDESVFAVRARSAGPEPPPPRGRSPR